MAGVETVLFAAGIASETDYAVYLAAEDAAGNLQTTPVKLTFATPDITAPANVTAFTATALLKDSIALSWTSSVSPDADSIAHFRSLLDWLNDRGIALLVVYIPNSPVTEERWVDVEPTMLEVIAEACRARGVSFLSCDPDDVPRTNADFLNEFHAAPALARHISRRAARYITELGLLDSASAKLAGIDGFETEAP